MRKNMRPGICQGTHFQPQGTLCDQGRCWDLPAVSIGRHCVNKLCCPQIKTLPSGYHLCKHTLSPGYLAEGREWAHRVLFFYHYVLSKVIAESQRSVYLPFHLGPSGERWGVLRLSQIHWLFRLCIPESRVTVVGVWKWGSCSALGRCSRAP